MLMAIASGTFAQTTKKTTAATSKTASTPTKSNTATNDDPPATNTGTVVANSSGKDVVAIYHFTSAREFSYDYAIGMGNAVEAGFVRSGRFTVVERNRFGTIKEEEKFREANTNDIVSKASKFGAKIIVTGHIVSVSQGDVVSSTGLSTGTKYAEISLSFKIIDVQSGEIKFSEIINGKGDGSTSTEAMLNAYVTIDNLVRRNIGAFMPQQFKFMSVVSKMTRKKKEYVDKIKIWGGSDHGLKVGDAVHIYTVSYLTNPNTGKQVEEKKILAHASIIEINSGSTSTCTIINTAEASKFNDEILPILTGQPEKLIIEYKGSVEVKAPSLWKYLTQ